MNLSGLGLLDGNVGIGTTVPVGLLQVGTSPNAPLVVLASGNVGVKTNSPGYDLDVAGQAHATAFPTSSDIRLKENIVNLSASGSILEKLKRIRGVYFDWNNICKSLGRATKGRQIGVIAQEVEPIFPELVTISSNGSGYKGVDYGRFSSVLLEGIKEQQRQIEEQQKSIEELKREVEKLKQSIISSTQIPRSSS